MTLDEIKVNPIFESLLPPLTDDEYDDLEKDIIARQKVLNPILVWSKTNEIVDGHNRYKIIEDNNIPEYTIDTLDFDSESAVMKWIVEHQFAKRNLTKSQKVTLLQKVEEKVREEAENRKLSNLKQNSEGSNLTQRVEPAETGRTAEIMASKIGISKNTYKDMKLIVEKGTESQIERMDKGGHGNGVATIAQEIKDGIPEGFRKCNKCGRVLSIDLFAKPKADHYCLECKKEMNRQSALRRAGDNGKETKTTKRKLSIADPYGLADTYYNPDYVPEKTVGDIKADFKSLFDDLDINIKRILDYNASILNTKENLEEVANELAKYASHIKYLEGEVRNARL